MAKQQDTLDRTVAFLQKREGIDKTLKIVRYTSRLIAAVSPPGSDQRKRFEALQSSVGTSRKAYRLGKFLQDVNSARKMKAWTSSSLALLELVAYAGEGTYYFLDQFLWLMKAGFIPKHNESSVSKVSAWAEVVGYAANIILSLNKYQQLVHQEQALARKIDSLWKDSVDGSTVDPSLTAQLSLLRSARLLRLALIVQDLADSMTAINDITGERWIS
eukprot:GHUV01010841.1.p1 GENE.GHUV01010841.1~~GHUV01010841.1.p1  ORF type:complete len:217 (+),score=52.11 GHUV01010841.1:287-937(+)